MLLPPSLRLAGLLSVCVLGSSVTAFAQVRHPGAPAADKLDDRIPTFEVPAPDVDMLMAEDALNEQLGPGPLRFGVMTPVPRNFGDAADWSVTNDGELLVARMRFHAPGAHSLGVEFSQYQLPPEGRVFLYDDALVNVLGAYTQEEQIPTGEFVIEPFPGDTVILEYSQPAHLETTPLIELRGLIYDYKNIFAMEAALDSQIGDGGCDKVHVNCPEGDPFPLQKRSTVRTLSGGGLCSGSLINNTLNDGTQYLYTAQHCGQSSTTVVRFNYQTPGCGGGGAPTNNNVSGLQLLASDTDTDGRLMRITGNIPDSYNPYYAGWSRSSTNLTFGMSMHHPGGTPKRISIDSNGGGKSTQGFIGIGSVRVWNMNFQVGVTEGGSSGGPLFDNNGHIRGTLTGGPTSPCTVSYYGRFFNFWNDVDLSPWLDPNGTGLTSIEGFDPFSNQAPPSISSINPTTGAEAGFTSITLSGSGFLGVSLATFDGVDAMAIDVQNDSTLVLLTPPGTLGTSVDVRVQNNAGSDTEVNGFTYVANPAPNISSLSPDQGLITGGTTVTIAGSNVLGVTDVQFGGVSGNSINIINSTALTVNTPPGAAGTVDVEAFGNGSDLIVDGFTYVAQGQFITIGVGHPGTGGVTPQLFGSGDLTPGGTGFDITGAAIQPGATGVLWVSLTEGAAPFKGGTVYTIPILLQIPVQANFIGLVGIPGTLDNTVPAGTEFVVQMAFSDAQASAGVSMSNGLKVVVGG